MKCSRGEIKICDILDMAGLQYKEEYSFSDLVSSSGRPLRFDFAVFDDNGELDFLIEFQGIQHYEAKSKFGGAQGLYLEVYEDQIIIKGREFEDVDQTSKYWFSNYQVVLPL